jgi:hypothetical protein
MSGALPADLRYLPFFAGSPRAKLFCTDVDLELIILIGG